MSTAETKQILRTRAMQFRKTLGSEKIEQASNLIVQNCVDGINWQSVKSIQIYLPIVDKKEINTWPLLRYLWKSHPHINTSVPVIRNSRIYSAPIRGNTVLQPGHYGTTEPLQPTLLPGNHKFDVIIVPTLGFDRLGHRLGYGKGYFDKFLSSHTGITIGFAYAQSEIKPNVPVEGHDIALNYIATEKELIAVL